MPWNRERIVCLRAGDYRAVVDLAAGGNCISLRNNRYGAMLLREPEDPDRKDNPYLYGMPILFPANRISGGRFTFDGREYKFPVNEPATGCHLHGTLHLQPFEVQQMGENILQCVYRADEETPYLTFPHSFSVTLRYELTESGLRQGITIENRSHTEMPVLLGFHTTFCALFSAGSKPGDSCVRVPISREYARNMQNYLPTGETPALDAVSQGLNEGSFDPMATPMSRHYRADPGAMVIYDRKKNLSLVYETDPQFRFRLIYNGNADGYICLEPQTCLVDWCNGPLRGEKDGIDCLAPGQTKYYENKIYIAEGDHR